MAPLTARTLMTGVGRTMIDAAALDAQIAVQRATKARFVAMRREEIEAVRLIQGERFVAGYEKLSCVQAQRHNYTIILSPETFCWPLSFASSNWKYRTITSPAFTPKMGLTDAKRLYIWRTHEGAHVIAGGCPNVAPHRHDASVTTSWNCLECERLAWATAERISAIPFDREMWAELKRCLGSYRWTPAPTPVLSEANRLMSFSGYARARQARVQREIAATRRALVEKWRRECRC